MILVIIMLVTSFSAVGVLMPGMRGERFSELGILGPDLKLGDYPTVVVASETVHFYTYVGNQMGEPMFYTVLVKLTDNSTQAVPANVSAIAQSQRVLSDNETWICPVDVTFSHVGDNQRLIFELWVYNQTLQIDQYHNRWGQIWLNVTKPDV